MDGLDPIALITTPDGTKLVCSRCLIWRDNRAFRECQNEVTSTKDVDGFLIQMLVGPYTSSAVVEAAKRYTTMAKEAPEKGGPFSPSVVELPAKKEDVPKINLKPFGGKHKVNIWRQTHKRIFMNPKAAYVWAFLNEPKYHWEDPFYEIVVSDVWGKLVGVCIVPASPDNATEV